jgi:hypothetical protein
LEQNLNFSILESDDIQWLNFASNRQEAHIFHHPAWAGFLAKTYGFKPFIAAVKTNSGQIMAGLPIMEINDPLKKRQWISLPFTDHCAPLYSDQTALNFLESGILQYVETLNNYSLELRWSFSSPYLFRATDYVLSITTIKGNSDDLAKKINSNDFRNIKKAEKRGISIENGISNEQLREFYSMHIATRRRHGVPVQPWRFFVLLKQEILDRGLGQIWIARKDENPIAGTIFLHWYNTLTYKFGASIEQGRENFANDLLMWRSMCWGCQNGYTILDWGRSDIGEDGLRRYKKKWGSEEMLLEYSRNFQNTTHGFRERLTPIVKKVINNSPLWVCRLSGELLYRYFGV